MSRIATAAEFQEMLQETCFTVRVNCNDTFGYACADSEDIDVEDLPIMLELYQKFGWEGVIALCSKIRKCDPLSEVRNDKFKEAQEYIKDYELKGIDYSAWQEEVRKKYGI